MTSRFSGAVCSGTIERARSAARFRRGSGGKLGEGEEAAGGKGERRPGRCRQNAFSPPVPLCCASNCALGRERRLLRFMLFFTFGCPIFAP